ncbi:TetR/AcrR family transcriptional regulator [Streptomyces avicenniae]|uniref:TetR/AcrR family transcriptional regulator n=1 Tax=Streptomyces avicenniae TaxID=500153 RepID=UPI00069B1CF7|nr:TetR family transcriptional regulator [Streptomyces avicenniae]
MRTRDPEAKRQQLLGAALAEFAEFGMAGARVDRLARRAGISPGLVYAFHKGKAELFDAVFDHIVELTVSSVPIDADRLPEYAGRLHDGGVEHPEVMRFLTWYHLERGESAQRAVVAEAMREKVEAVAEAQRRGAVTGAMPAAQVLALVLGLAAMWHRPGEDLAALVPAERRRAVVVEAVARLVAP